MYTWSVYMYMYTCMYLSTCTYTHVNVYVQWNLPIVVTLGPETFGPNKEVVAIQVTLINRPSELFNLIDHIIKGFKVTMLLLQHTLATTCVHLSKHSSS